MHATSRWTLALGLAGILAWAAGGPAAEPGPAWEKDLTAALDDMIASSLSSVSNGTPVQEVRQRVQVLGKVRAALSQDLQQGAVVKALQRVMEIFDAPLSAEEVARLSRLVRQAAMDTDRRIEARAVRAAALVEATRAKCMTAREAADLNEIARDLRALADELRRDEAAGAPASAARESVERALPVIHAFQDFLNATRANESRRAEAALTVLRDRCSTNGVLDYAYVSGLLMVTNDAKLSLGEIAPMPAYTNIVPRIHNLQDLLRAEEELEALKAAGRNALGDFRDQMRRGHILDTLLNLAGLHRSNQIVPPAQALQDVLAFNPPFSSIVSGEPAIRTVRSEIQEIAFRRVVETMPSLGLRPKDGEEIGAFILRAAMDLRERKQWDDLEVLLLVQKQVAAVPPMDAEGLTADIQAIQAWRRAVRYRDAGELPHAVDEFMSVLQLSVRFGPTEDAVKALRALREEHGTKYEEAMTHVRQWRENREAMQVVIGQLLRNVRFLPPMRYDGQWQELTDVLRDEIRRITGAPVSTNQPTATNPPPPGAPYPPGRPGGPPVGR